MEIKDLLTGVLSKTFNLDENGVASLFNEDGTVKDDAEQTILNLDAERVKALKSNSTKTSFDDGYKKAQSELLSKFENEFKAKTGYKSDKKGIDLILDYANNVSSSKGELTDELVKKHPLFLSLQEEKDRAVQEAIMSGEENLNKFKSEINKKETFNKVAEKANELFLGMKPVLSSDPVKAKRQTELFLQQLNGFEYEIQDNERIVILKDGKVYEDDHGNRVTLDKIVKNITTSYFDVHEHDPKGSTKNHQAQQQNKKQFVFDTPKTAEEYASLVSKASSLEEKIAIKEAFEKNN